MSAKLSLILTLILSLLFTTQAQPVVIPVEMKQGGMCANMPCAHGCCANVVCCKIAQQQRAPQKPTTPPQDDCTPLATIGLRTYILLLPPPAPRRPVVIQDDIRAAHSLPPLAVSCIRLI